MEKKIQVSEKRVGGDGCFMNTLEWNNELQEGFRSNLVLLTELFATILVQCFPSEARNINDEKLNIILQDLCHRRGNHSSAPFETYRYAEPYVLLEGNEYLREMNYRELSVYEHPELDETLRQLRSSTIEATEAGQVAAACEEVEEALPKLNRE